MKPYPAYKESGVEWVDKLPSHWSVLPLKYAAIINREALTEQVEDDVELQYIDIGNVNQLGIINPPERMKFIDAPSRARRIIKKNDTIISTVRTYLKAVAFIDSDEENLIVSTGFATLTSLKETFPKYLYYLVSSQGFVDTVSAGSVGVSYPAITSTELARIITWLPPLPEQRAIAEFLDCKTAQIDKLIGKKQRQIDLLQEQRTAVINHAVTKGLNPDVPMTVSDVKWLGEIPSHWGVKKLKHVTRKINDGTHITPTYVDQGIPFLRVTDIQTDEIDLESVKRIPESEHAELYKRCNPEKGDLLLSKNGTIGITKVVDWDYPFSLFVSICLIKFNEQMNPYFFSYFFQSDVVNEQISSGSKTTSVTNLHLDKIRELIIVVPSKAEQQELINWLDKEMKKISQLVDLVSRQIEFLKEYRTALISEAVTGKIDVRGETIHE